MSGALGLELFWFTELLLPMELLFFEEEDNTGGVARELRVGAAMKRAAPDFFLSTLPPPTFFFLPLPFMLPVLFVFSNVGGCLAALISTSTSSLPM